MVKESHNGLKKIVCERKAHAHPIYGSCKMFYQLRNEDFSQMKGVEKMMEM